MDEVVYNIPLHLFPAYRGRRVVVRSRDAEELVRGIREDELDAVVGVQLLSLKTDAGALADWGQAVPVELMMRHPATEYPLLYRHAKLLDKHPTRASIHVAPGFRNAVKVAAALQFAIKLEVGQPGPEALEELREVLDFYLHHRSVSQPVEYFHSALLAFHSYAVLSLWDAQEEDPAFVRYITDEGRETVARDTVGATVAGDLSSFVPEFKRRLLAEGCECAGCEFFGNCGGYFKWPRADYSCGGVKEIFQTLREAAGELRQSLEAFSASQAEAAQ
jgi:hypothetical protein